MILRTHIFFAVLIDVCLDFHVNFFTILGSTLPDIDLPSTPLGQSFNKLSQYLYRRFGHRGLTHSVYWSLLFGALSFINKDIFLQLCIGYTAHIFLDMFTPTGVKLFYPWNVNFTMFNGCVETGKRGDIILGIASIIIACLIIFYKEGFFGFLTS
ncbi:MAG: metal-dependent hydrolase [Candidatus Nanoarchaeia archaeon]|nr:metal-dependent hydrolase [Candidatus Nanoarchaeia archaeon]